MSALGWETAASADNQKPAPAKQASKASSSAKHTTPAQ